MPRAAAHGLHFQQRHPERNTKRPGRWLALAKGFGAEKVPLQLACTGASLRAARIQRVVRPLAILIHPLSIVEDNASVDASELVTLLTGEYDELRPHSHVRFDARTLQQRVSQASTCLHAVEFAALRKKARCTFVALREVAPLIGPAAGIVLPQEPAHIAIASVALTDPIVGA
jgi:hypothetical protein